MQVHARKVFRQLLQDYLDLRAQREARLEEVVDADAVARGAAEAGHDRDLPRSSVRSPWSGSPIAWPRWPCWPGPAPSPRSEWAADAPTGAGRARCLPGPLTGPGTPLTRRRCAALSPASTGRAGRRGRGVDSRRLRPRSPRRLRAVAVDGKSLPGAVGECGRPSATARGDGPHRPDGAGATEADGTTNEIAGSSRCWPVWT